MKRYRPCLLAALVSLALTVVKPELGIRSLSIAADNLMTVVTVLPPVFVLIGLLEVWGEREAMTKLMGESSGLAGVVVALLMGSVAAGPLYAAFPVAGALMRKGGKLSNVLVFVGAWSTTKIPLLLFETSSLGWKLMLGRLVLDVPAVVAIGYLSDRLLTRRERALVYDLAKALP